MKPVIAVVGGFLGAGKTTLILAAARALQHRGMRVGIILNDQGDDLVDTRYVECFGLPNAQVTGGCFCCRFPDLVRAAGQMLDEADVIFAEAVGSCTDLAATTLRPLLDNYHDRFRVAPLTVLVHPARKFDDPNLDFLYQNQLAEADLIVERDVSVSGWLDQLLSGAVPVGSRPLNLDYTRYAEAETALAWLNARVTARARPPVTAAMLVGPLLDRLEAQIRIVHLKLFTQCDAGYLKAALTGNGQQPIVDGALDASPSAKHEILINVRALTEPESLRDIVERELAALPARVTWRHMQCFRPAPPQRPAYRSTAAIYLGDDDAGIPWFRADRTRN